jgi:hypothetical protein
MRLFSAAREQTPVQIAEAALGTAQERRDRLAVQLTQTQAELATIKQQAASAALREAPLEVSEIAGEVAAQCAAVEALAAAHAAASAEVVAAEQALAVERDREQRAASVAELTALVAEIRSGAPPFKAALGNLVGLLNRGGEISHDAKSVAGVFTQVEIDADELLRTACAALEHHAKQIGAGLGRATLPRPQPAPVAIPAPPPTTPMVPLYDVRWSDAAGAIRYAAYGWDCPLPIATAQRALVAGICVACDDPRAIKARRERGSVHADLDRAVDLDQTNPTVPGPPAERLINPSKAVWQLPGDTPPSWFGKPT